MAASAHTPGHRIRFLTIVRAVVIVLLTGGFLWISFRGIDLHAVVEAAAGASYGWIGVSLIFLFLSHLLRAWRWGYLLAPMKPGIGLRPLFSGVMIGYLVNNVIPRGGELVRPFVISRLEGVSRSSALGTIVVERIIDTLSFLTLVSFLPIVYQGPLRDSFPWLAQAGWIIASVTVSGLVVLVTLMVRRDWTNGLLRVATRLLPDRFAAGIENVVHRFLDGLLFLQNPRSLVIVTLSSVGVWFLYILMMQYSLVAFGLGDLGFAGAVVVQTISSIGVAIPTPGATGSYHIFTAQTLSRLFGVPNVVAISFATVTHAAGYVSTTLVGLWFVVRDHISVRETLRREEEGGGKSAL
jgi:glycosyltransferase 2 family protein